MRILVATCVAAIGCSERALPLPEPDLAHAPSDLGAADLGTCGDHTRELVPLTSFDTLDGSRVYHHGSTVRVRITFSLRQGCDWESRNISTEFPPATGAQVMNATVGAYAWIQVGAERCGPPETITRVIESPDWNTYQDRMIVQEAAPPGGPTLRLSSLEPLGFVPGCLPALAGGPCSATCECNGSDPSLVCLVDTGGLSRCGRPCTQDSECGGPGTPSLCEGAPGYACGPALHCRAESECPFGQHVEDCACRLDPHPATAACGCDAECGSDAVCGPDGCVQVCSGPHTCGGAWDERAPGAIACMDGRCVAVQ